MEGYCLKCKKKHKMERVKKEKIKGRTYAKGFCKKHGTKMSKIL